MKAELNFRKSRSFLLLAFLLAPPDALRAQQEKVVALKQELAANHKRLLQYEWVETTIVSLKGEEKSRMEKQCYYGADGKVQKQQISAPAEQSSKRGLRGKVIAKKKAELSEYMKQAIELVHMYLPPSPERIQAAKDAGKLAVSPTGPGSARLDFTDFVKPGDRLSISLDLANNRIQTVKVTSYLESEKDPITLDATFATLEDGTSYTANSVLVAAAKDVQVVVQNSGYRQNPKATPPDAARLKGGG